MQMGWANKPFGAMRQGEWQDGSDEVWSGCWIEVQCSRTEFLH